MADYEMHYDLTRCDRSWITAEALRLQLPAALCARCASKRFIEAVCRGTPWHYYPDPTAMAINQVPKP